ncbi:acyltransferase family protein [Hydrogenophaga sp. PBL-H3]|uniref:acyltransferase family protein n=1 Tax=Hydrogenophaga sp. PBL-H3 TaxID=434010 RepID=UPI00131F6778|nr:acyltransferase family protein [Hydrogenophaga sp. PBL-H3]QHE76716.1 acyltransferase [Hydrogenophaga sp. PBL-H3]QHE81140.1 acyltransferase [Hydrogenophaga sp. PBL-H3]
MITSASFRNDINGLRAWAVVAVLLYHFAVPGFQGGFVGVDVFFVISGFLMTGIVVSGLEQESGFDLWAFYRARARRIIPALSVLCAVLLVLGWFFLIPQEYELLGAHTVSSLMFLSNVMFWNEAGYFDAASHEKWLLHTWSLAVEWQFYFFLPLILMMIWRIQSNRANVFWIVVAFLIASLAMSVALTPLKPIAAFYLLPTRAWEMLAGGAVYLASNRLVIDNVRRRLLEYVGFFAIGLSVVYFDSGSEWPGWRALIPVLGAMLVLLSAQANSVLSSGALIQWIGFRSYSIYLWHWPVVVVLYFLELQDNWVMVSVGMLFAFILGHYSFICIEKKSQSFFSNSKSKFRFEGFMVFTAVIATAGALVSILNGVSGRLSVEIEIAAKEANNTKPRRDTCFVKQGESSPSCIYGQGDKLRAILIGDSHADSLTTALAAAVPSGDGGVLDWSYVSCPTIIGVKNLSPKFKSNENCNGFLNWTVSKLEQISQDIPLVIVNRSAVYALGHNEPWENDLGVPMVYFTKAFHKVSPEFLTEYARQLTDTACQFAKSRRVFLVRPIPEMGVHVPKAVVRAIAWGKDAEISIPLDQYHQRQAFIWAAQDEARDRCGVSILDPLPYLCHEGRCHGAKDGRPLYFDDDHLSEWGNKFLVPMFAEVFKSE